LCKYKRRCDQQHGQRDKNGNKLLRVNLPVNVAVVGHRSGVVGNLREMKMGIQVVRSS